MNTLAPRAAFSPVLAQFGRMLVAKAESLPSLHLPDGPQPNDPVFLQDFACPMPDQAQETRYGRGRFGATGRVP